MGGTNTTARALKSIEEEYKGTDQWDAIYKKVCKKAVIYIILSQDDTYKDYIQKNWPDIRAIHDKGTFWRFAYMWKSVPAELTTKLSGNWFRKNILTGHGPLLANYKTMGDGTILEGELDNEQRGVESRIGALQAMTVMTSFPREILHPSSICQIPDSEVLKIQPMAAGADDSALTQTEPSATS